MVLSALNATSFSTFVSVPSVPTWRISYPGGITPGWEAPS
jgi:hypothetical protein